MPSQNESTYQIQGEGIYKKMQMLSHNELIWQISSKSDNMDVIKSDRGGRGEGGGKEGWGRWVMDMDWDVDWQPQNTLGNFPCNVLFAATGAGTN